MWALKIHNKDGAEQGPALEIPQILMKCSDLQGAQIKVKGAEIEGIV